MLYRKILLLSFCSLCFVGVRAYSQAATVTHIPILGEAVSLITPGSAEFERELSAIADANSKEALAPLLPYCLFVRNNSSQPIYSVTLVYRSRDLAGAESIISNGLRMSVRPRPRFLLPGEAAFLAPMAGLSRIAKPANRTFQSSQVFQVERDRVVQGFAAKVAVSIALDSVVFSDGTLAGPDAAHRFDTYRGLSDAEQSVLAIVKSASQADVFSQLSSLASAAVTETPASTYAYWYAQRRQQFASELLAGIARNGDRYAAFRNEVLALNPLPFVKRK